MTNNMNGAGSVEKAQAVAQYELRYHAQISQIEDCPCALTGAYEKLGYHLVQANLQSPRNFLPMAKKDPSGYAAKAAAQRCPWWSLSMFEKPEQLRKRFTKARLSSPKAEMLLGDHYVCFKLNHTKGRISAPAPSGHFEFFEYTTFDPAAEALDHQKLYP
jgi:hypothetical protein